MQGNGRRAGQGGFTLIELLVVVAIIAVLAAFLLPSYLGAVEEGKLARIQSDVATISRQTAIKLSQTPTPAGNTININNDLELTGKLNTTLVTYNPTIAVTPGVTGATDGTEFTTATLTLTIGNSDTGLADRVRARLEQAFPQPTTGTGTTINVVIFRAKRALTTNP